MPRWLSPEWSLLAAGATEYERRELAKVTDGDGTLLDHAMFLYGSNMSNSDRHNGHPLPTVLVGGGNGKHKGGQHLELREPTPLANVHLTILERSTRGRTRSGTAPA